MSLYHKLRLDPPVLKVEGNPREIKIDVVSVMCDNKYRWSVKKIDGDYKISTHPQSFSNFGTKYKRDDIEWEMDEGNWEEVWEMINSGTIQIEKIKYRDNQNKELTNYEKDFLVDILTEDLEDNDECISELHKETLSSIITKIK
tara:strand:+ start:5972 stop:6403 length:432 start_codon:yes stop_codon:yes gene_type:complete